MPDNEIKIQGDGNITIQNVKGQDISININQVAEFEKLVEGLSDKIVVQLLKELNQKSSNTFTNAKNIVTGNIKARNIHIGDIYNIKSPALPRQLTAQFPTTDPDQIVGRKNDLDKVRQQLSANKQVVLVNGIGGVGKTTLAQAYAHVYGGEYAHVAWINCLSQDFAADVVQTANLLQNLRINATGKDPKTLCLEVLNNISNLEQTPGLLIIDNAEADLSRYINALPKAPGWHTLITSRKRLGNEHFTELALDFLAAEDAELLFQKHYTRSDLTRDNIKELVEMIDYHTLTIEILAKTAQKQRYKMPDLRQALPTNLKANIKTKHNDNQTIERVTSYLVSIFNLSQLKPDELWLMQQFTCLPPEFHDYDTLLELIQPEASKRSDVFSETLEDLVDKGWLLLPKPETSKDSKDKDSLLLKEDKYKMHRIIGEVTTKTQPPRVDDVLPLIKSVVDKLGLDQTKDNPVDKFPWIAFGEAILNQFEDNYAPQIAVLQNNLALMLKFYGNYERAKILLEKAIRSDEQNFGERHYRTANSYSHLGVVLRNLGDYEGAKVLLEQAMHSDEQNFGKLHPEVGIRYSNLGIVLRDLGDYEGARVFLEKAMRYAEQNFGEQHNITVTIYSNLATVLKDLGDYEEAKALLQKAIRSDEKNFGEQHLNTAIRYSNLGIVLRDLGDYEGARVFLEKATHSAEQNFGEQHPNIATIYHNLATVYVNLNEAKKAVDLWEKAYAVFYNTFGAEDPKTKIVEDWLDEYKPKP